MILPPIIQVGMSTEELVKLHHKDLDPEEVLLFHARMTQIKNPKIICGNNLDGENVLDKFSQTYNPNPIIVVGAWGELCVAGIVAGAIDRGLSALVPSDMVFEKKDMDGELSDMTTAPGFWIREAKGYEYFETNLGGSIAHGYRPLNT